MKLITLLLLLPSIAFAQKAEMPALDSFTIGDAWEYRRIDTRATNSEPRFTVVNDDGVLYFSNGRIKNRVDTWYQEAGMPTAKTYRMWPLEVGKKWSVDWNLTNEGVTVSTKQDAVVTAYEEVTVPAGKFMAFKIEYKGTFGTSRGSSGPYIDTYWYAPEVKTDVRRIHDEGNGRSYTRELVSYTPAK